MKYLAILTLFAALTACNTNNGNNTNPNYNIWGDMTVRKTTSDSVTLPGFANSTNAVAEFYRTPNSYSTRVAVASVSANGQQLTDNGLMQYAFEPIGGINAHIFWVVSGNSQVAGFLYDDVGSFPDYTGPKIPDTIVRANGFTMSFPAGAITGGDSVAINLFPVAHTATTLFQYKGMDQNHNVVFSPQELSVLQPGRNFAELIISKSTYHSFSGKLYHFGKERVYTSIVVIQ